VSAASLSLRRTAGGEIDRSGDHVETIDRGAGGA
jgi:hypothetical protein